MNDTQAERWAQWRLSIIGALLSSPPEKKQLHASLVALSEKAWQHPFHSTVIRVGVSTLERWYYRAKNNPDVIVALEPQRRHDRGHHRNLSALLVAALETQYRDHPGWTVQLHVDNLKERVAADPTLGRLPSYSTVRRLMKNRGWHRKVRLRQTPGGEQAAQRLEQREVRSYEAAYVNALWHLDFHHGSRLVLNARGEWIKPFLLGILDDRSRLVGHLQWYTDETAQSLVHGFSQALQKRGLPRALMTDNGAAMVSEEFTRGLAQLGIQHETTLPYSPYQNGKQESFWATVEGRLMAMLENRQDLSLKELNEITQVWLDQDYQRRHHSELGMSPLQRFLDGPSVDRPSPDSDTLRNAFQCRVKRRQRRSDGTFTLHRKRFEVPDRYRHLDTLWVSYARWDLSRVRLLNPDNAETLSAVYPQDKTANAEGQRRQRQTTAEDTPTPPSENAPLLQKMLDDFYRTGKPPAHIPTPEVQP